MFLNIAAGFACVMLIVIAGVLCEISERLKDRAQ